MPLANIGSATGVMPIATPQIDISDVLQVNKEMNQALLANIQLHQALADQTGLSDKQRNAAASKADLETQQNKADSSLVQKQSQVKSAGLDSDLQTIPAQTAVNLGDIQAKKTLQPGTLAMALQGQNTAIPQNQFLANEVNQDPSGGLTKSRQMYETIFGAPAKKDDGSVDYDAMQTMNHQVASARLRAMMLNANSPLTKDMFDLLKAKNRVDLAFNPDGSIRQPADIAKDIQNLPTPLTPEEIQKARQDYISLNEGKDMLNKLRTGVNDPTHDIVGSKAFQGRAPGQLLASGLASLGFNDDKYQKQQDVQRTANGALMDKMKTFSGMRWNQKEFGVLRDTMPNLATSKDEWNKYIDRASGVLDQSMNLIKNSIPQGLDLPDSSSAKPAPAAPAAAANASLPVVNSQQAYDALPSGAQFKDGTGAVGRKP